MAGYDVDIKKLFSAGAHFGIKQVGGTLKWLRTSTLKERGYTLLT
jgi:hypothetical protein